MSSVERRRLRGFTLLELIVALSISGLVVLTAREISGRLAISAGELQQGTGAFRRRVAADGLLRGWVGQIDASRDAVFGKSTMFAGTQSSLDFHTWCQRAPQWEEHCWIHLDLVPTSRGAVILRAYSSATGTVDLDSIPGPAGFRYLLDPGNGARWLPRWNPTPFAPSAIAIVTASDTTILSAGPRV